MTSNLAPIHPVIHSHLLLTTVRNRSKSIWIKYTSTSLTPLDPNTVALMVCSTITLLAGYFFPVFSLAPATRCRPAVIGYFQSRRPQARVHLHSLTPATATQIIVDLSPVAKRQLDHAIIFRGISGSIDSSTCLRRLDCRSRCLP